MQPAAQCETRCVLPPAGGVRVRELLADCRPLYNARITGRALSLARALAQCTIGISDNGYVRGSARERTQGRKAAAAAAGFGDAFCVWLPLHQDDMTAAFGLVAAVGPVHARCAVSTEDPVRRVRFRRRRRLQRGRAGRATLRAPINIVLTTPEYSAATRDEDLLPLPRSPGPRPSCPLQCCCINSPRRASGEIDRVICPQNRRINLDTAIDPLPLPLPLSHPHFSGLLLRCSPPAHGATGKAVH